MGTVTANATNFGDLVINSRHNGGMILREDEGIWILDFGYMGMTLDEYRAKAAGFSTPARDEALEILSICKSLINTGHN